MTQDLPRGVTEADIEAYRRDGIVCLRGLFDADWVAFLRARIEEDKANPSGMVKNINAEGATGFFFAPMLGFSLHHSPTLDCRRRFAFSLQYRRRS